jgi:peroxiredoxin
MSEQRRRLGVGDRVTPFTLPSSTGSPVTLHDLLARGPLVLAWYLFDFGRI